MPSNPATRSLYVWGFATVPFKNEITKRVCGYQDTESKLTFHKECGCLWVRRF